MYLYNMPLIVIGDPHPQKRRAVSNKTPKQMTKQASRLVSQNFMVPKGREKKGLNGSQQASQ